MTTIKALIIDDEPLARQNIGEFLDSHPEVTIVAECQDAHEALKAIGKKEIDLLFLDIQMPEINGFELLKRLKKFPYIIFCTEYDQYALVNLERNKIDYLLKPIVQTRFDIAIEKVRRDFIERNKDTTKIGNLLKSLTRRNN